MLKAVETDLNSVEENARQFYTERDGKFYLQVTPADGLALEDVTGLKRSLESERTKHTDARRQVAEATKMLEAFGDLDPIAARKALEASASGDIESQVAARVEALRAGIAQAAGAEASAAKAELETTRGTLASREKQLAKLVKSAAISAELDRLAPLDTARDILAMHAGRSVEMQETDGEVRAVVMKDGSPALDAQGAPLTLRRFMEQMREDRAELFKPTKVIAGLGTSPQDRGTGRGAPGAMGPNPWSKATRNLTQQVLLQERNPALAARLRAEAA